MNKWFLDLEKCNDIRQYEIWTPFYR